MRKVNLGLIGLGFVGMVHMRNCLKLKSAKVVAAADLSQKALKIARERGVKELFTDYNELLKQPSIDAVLVSLPTYLHMPCAVSAAEEGKHIFLEKPLAGKLEDGKEIISAVKKHGVKLMVGYPFRFSSTFQDLKQKIETGALGDIQVAHAVNIGAGPFFHRAESATPKPVPEWWLKKELSGGGALMDLGSHLINLTRWYFGEIKSIKAYLGYRFNFDFEDYAVCIANFERETTAIINVGWFSQKAAIGIEVYGTAAHASGYYHSPNKAITAMQLILGKTSKFFAPYLKEVSHFVDCILKDAHPSTSGDDALKDIEMIECAYRNQISLEQIRL
ncbi:Gfo/Idh/MocA family oxidoreductase [Candidatus Bathyarchaeota archaeon]|nr:Gfo/Idh/MocA family oxidoreductase [Candidatus Bathyarchaeota archaeon]